MEDTTLESGQVVDSQALAKTANVELRSQAIATKQEAEQNMLNHSTPQKTDNGYNIPDEYKEAGWAKNIKSEQDLWKTLANAQTLIGKKTIGLPDWNNAEQANEFLSKLRPESPEGYTLPDHLTAEEKTETAKMLHNAGLSDYQANKLLTDFYAGMETKQQAMFSPESLKASLMNEFKDPHKIAEIHKEVLDIFGADFVDNPEITNSAIVQVYKAMDKIKQAYGVKTLEANLNAPSSVGTANEADLQKAISDDFKWLNDNSGKPFMEEKRKEVLQRYNSNQDKLFKMRGNK